MATLKNSFEHLIGLGGLRPPEPKTISEFIDAALEELNSVAPKLVRFDITGDGSDEYPLGTTGTSIWQRGFSIVRCVEWRDSADFAEEPTYLTDEEYDVEYDDSDAAIIRFTESPSSSDKVIVEYTVRHVLSESASTLDAKDEQAFRALVEAYILDALANDALGREVHATDAIADPDIERAREFRAASKAKRAFFERHFGLSVDGGAPAASAQRAALGYVDVDPGDPRRGGAVGSNRYRHTHARRRY